MITSLSTEELIEYIGHQLDTFFPDKKKLKGEDIKKAISLGLERTEHCFKHVALPAYFNGGETKFSHLHSDQYSQFLYYFSNSLWKISENKEICDKITQLNKFLNGMFWSYKGELPDIFILIHPVGTVIGNAVYSDFLVVLQNVTINTNSDEHGNPAPTLGRGLFLGAGAKIIGGKPVGDRVSIGVDALVYKQEIKDDSVVFSGRSGAIEIEQRKKGKCMAQTFFNVEIK